MPFFVFLWHYEDPTKEKGKKKMIEKLTFFTDMQNVNVWTAKLWILFVRGDFLTDKGLLQQLKETSKKKEMTHSKIQMRDTSLH